MLNVTGKTALITGATGGIGFAIAQTLHKQGATVVLSGTREQVLQEHCAQLGERAFALPCNLKDREQAAGLFDKAEELAGSVDILVCNAGLTRDNLVLRLKQEDWDTVIEVNLTSTMLLNQAAFKRMMKRKYGRIINIASVVAVSGNPGQANYVASKAGMIGMSKSIAQEAASRNITVNCVAPGFIRTDMTEILTDAQKEGILKNIPVGYMGEASDIAASVAFLASEEARYITGQTLHVNGGMVMI
ncbi:MAG: 3-oxoacyl-[acyl-carrier-protein] reductase [Alphaproteobacteria bacterium]|nr:3-oxoacyl-[acyl-carrier-protein] reductase [Alphaproteobacteria bacterium]